jgi:hypothetical protein
VDNEDVFLFLDNVSYDGYLYATARWNMDIVVFKFDSNLNIVWQKQIANVGFDSSGIFSIDPSNGHLYILANTAGTETNYLGTGGTSFVIRVNEDVSSILETFTVESSTAMDYIYGSSKIVWDDIDVVDNFIQLSGYTAIDGQTRTPVYLQVPKDATDRPLQLTFTAPGRTDTLTWRPTYGSYTISTTSLTAAYTTPTNVSESGANVETISLSSTRTPTYTTHYYFLRTLGQMAASAQFAVIANNKRIRSAQAVVSAQFNTAITAVKTARITRTLTAQATLTPNGGYIRGAEAVLQSTASVVARLGLIKLTTVAVNAQVNTTINPLYFKGTGVNLNVTSAVQANLGLIKRTDISLQAFNTQLSAVNKIGQGLIQLDIVAQQTTQAVKTASASIDQVVVATQTTNAVKTVLSNASIQATAQLAVSVVKIPATPVLMESAFASTITTDNSKITRVTLSATTQVSQSVQAIKTARTQTTLTTQANLTFGAQVTRLRLAESSQQVTAQLLAPAVKRVKTAVSLQAFNTVLAVGTKISFDPVLQLTIPSESGSLIVFEEDTLLMVPEETRVNMVRKIAI